MKERKRESEKKSKMKIDERKSGKSGWVAEIIKAKLLHMNDENDAKTNDLC